MGSECQYLRGVLPFAGELIAPQKLSEKQLPDSPNCLVDDLFRHLGCAGAPVDEENRYLFHTEAAAPDKKVHFDLESVAVGFYLFKIQPFQNLAAEAFKTAGRVLNRHPGNRASHT